LAEVAQTLVCGVSFANRGGARYPRSIGNPQTEVCATERY
jgi:hypothetical protein